jgi:hypothetical protein
MRYASRAALAAALLLIARPDPGRAATPVLVELFTSESCSSCPPADALLAQLARDDPGVVALDLHVTYWNNLGWRDRFSLQAATDRQRAYQRRLRLEDIYTPQLVAGGRHQAVGSDPTAVRAAIAAARADAAANNSPALRLVPGGPGLRLELGAGRGSGRVIVVGYDPTHVTRIGGGENSGRVLREINVVRSLATVGTWVGQPLTLDLPVPAGERTVAFVQAPDGAIRALAALPGQ